MSSEVNIMRAKIQKWGNSLAVRLPKAITEKAGLVIEDEVDIDVEDTGKVVLLPHIRKEYRLEELLTGITPSNLHGEIDFGEPHGREAL
jgi:antitoxin MazE